MPIAQAAEIGDNLLDCNRLQKYMQSLRNEVDNHEPWIGQIRANGQELIDSGHENSELFMSKLQELADVWNGLKEVIQTYTSLKRTKI